jgi:hypothetical protein
MRLAKTETLVPAIKKDAKRVRHYIGPVRVPGQAELEDSGATITYSDTNTTEQLRHESAMYVESISGLCRNCTVLGVKADLHFLNGTRVTIAHGIYNHHVVILETTKILIPWYLCDGQTGYGRVFSAGFSITGVGGLKNLFTTPDGKFHSGYYIQENSNFMMNAELVNYRNESTVVYVTLDLEYLEGKQSGWMDASTSLLSVTGCSPPDFQPPPGTVSPQS